MSNFNGQVILKKENYLYSNFGIQKREKNIFYLEHFYMNLLLQKITIANLPMIF